MTPPPNSVPIHTLLAGMSHASLKGLQVEHCARKRFFYSRFLFVFISAVIKLRRKRTGCAEVKGSLQFLVYSSSSLSLVFDLFEVQLLTLD
jgi:hypothetical protein